MNRRRLLGTVIASVVVGLVGGAGPAQAIVIEDFEDGDLAEYTLVTGLGALPTVTGAAAHDGSFGLEARNEWWAYRTDLAVSQGDILSVWVQFQDTADARAYFGFGASAAGTLSFVLAPNSGDIRFQENPGFSFTELDSSPQAFVADQWYLAEVVWGFGGSLTGNLYGSDGLTLLNTVSSSSNLYSTGGIAFRGFGGVKAFDTVSAEPVPEPGSLALLGLGLASLRLIRRRRHS